MLLFTYLLRYTDHTILFNIICPSFLYIIVIFLGENKKSGKRAQQAENEKYI